VVQGHKVIVR